ncbi:unnamed protein product, partial [Ilex paraguariensis]
HVGRHQRRRRHPCALGVAGDADIGLSKAFLVTVGDTDGVLGGNANRVLDGALCTGGGDADGVQGGALRVVGGDADASLDSALHTKGGDTDGDLSGAAARNDSRGLGNAGSVDNTLGVAGGGMCDIGEKTDGTNTRTGTDARTGKLLGDSSGSRGSYPTSIVGTEQER